MRVANVAMPQLNNLSVEASHAPEVTQRDNQVTAEVVERLTRVAGRSPEITTSSHVEGDDNENLKSHQTCQEKAMPFC